MVPMRTLAAQPLVLRVASDRSPFSSKLTHCGASATHAAA
eukprot:CAMPEP_0205895682 /NCGR_PEP_ID=MMETSP1083-20121108/24534_1 /ASSEMBLY_ACC=CAM_ASM_000430 /TAXON_ID=97485 /ORGANISM="Prymnesium parvum, Strain Texoma1" /LENGTH=39 /DNA_ID= /DNA_START= /DNA_END= /DNA_ORIENTATION=